jgi:D-sedoheptulose 7-phosphate isomerase
MSSKKRLDLIEGSLKDSVEAIRCINSGQLERIANMIVGCYRNGGKVMLCGNGGSASQAQHLAAELVCKFRRDRAPLSAMALNTDTSILTAQANDVSFETVFERQVEALGRKGDILVVLSTSGNSPNVVRALKAAKRKSIRTIALTGNNRRCKVANTADEILYVGCDDTPRIQEAHLAAGHIICDLVEAEFVSKRP